LVLFFVAIFPVPSRFNLVAAGLFSALLASCCQAGCCTTDMRCPFHHRDAHLIAALNSLTERIENMTDNFQTAEAASVIEQERAIGLLTSIHASLVDVQAKLDAAIAANDPVALQAAADALGAETAKLKAANDAAAPPAPAPAP
jgi:hypothetical protein